MSFCPKCGRPRGVNSRFCGGCGRDLGQPAADGETASAEPFAAVPPAQAPPAPVPPAAVPPAAVPPAEVPPAAGTEPAPAAEPGEPATLGPAEPTRLDVPVAQTRLDSQLDGGRPDQYASWYAEPSAADDATPPRDVPADQWKPADTGYAEPARGGYLPPPPAPAYPPPAAPGPAGQPSGGRGTAILVIVVVLVVLGAGGGAYALTRSHGHSTAQPPTTGPPSTGPTVQTPATPVVNASASPTATPSVSVTPSPTRTGTVQAAPGVASDAAEPQVEAYLNRYFSAINTRNYSAYQSLLDAQQQQGNSRSKFDSGFATTKDSNEVLTGIDDTGGGTLTANVSFTSRQSPGDSVDGSACNNWRISLFLVPNGTSYVMTAAPAGYHAAYTDC
jgi:hypothetical protein